MTHPDHTEAALRACPNDDALLAAHIAALLAARDPRGRVAVLARELDRRPYGEKAGATERALRDAEQAVTLTHGPQSAYGHRYGFGVTWYSDLDEFLVRGEEAARTMLLFGVGLRRCHPDGLRQLATTPSIGRVRELQICDLERCTSTAALLPLLASPLLGGVERLTLPSFGVEGARTLAANPAATRLRDLRVEPALGPETIRGEALGDEGLAALSRSPHLSGLRILSLSDQRVGRAGLEALAQASFAIQSLALAHESIGDAGGEAVGFIESLRALSLLHVDAGRSGLAGALARLPQLRELRVTDPVGGGKTKEVPGYEGRQTGPPHGWAADTLGALPAASLRVLNLFGAGLDGPGARLLARLAMPDLDRLDLGMNPLYDDGLMRLAEADAITPTTLSLPYVGQRRRGLEALLRSRMLARVESLDLSGIERNAGWADAFAAVPAPPKLVGLALDESDITESELQHFLHDTDTAERLHHLRLGVLAPQLERAAFAWLARAHGAQRRSAYSTDPAKEDLLAFAANPAAANVQVLSLRSSKAFDDEVARAWLASPYLSRATRVHIQGDQMSPSSREALAARVRLQG